MLEEAGEHSRVSFVSASGEVERGFLPSQSAGKDAQQEGEIVTPRDMTHTAGFT